MFSYNEINFYSFLIERARVVHATRTAQKEKTGAENGVENSVHAYTHILST
jgi:hypothetical protein